MRLLRLISWPYLRKHAVRSLLTVVGIVLGVAVFVAIHTANEAVFFAFERTVDRIAGAAQLQITSGETGFTEDVLERVQGIPEVQVAVPVIEAPAGTNLAGQGNILILGVDMTGDRSLRDYDLESGDEAIIDDPLVFLAQPDSIIITKEFADRNALTVGSRLTLSTMVGDRAFRVRGIMRSGGLTSAFGGNLAVMDIYAAQQVFGRGRRFDRIDLKLNEGVAVDAGRAGIQEALGVGFDVEAPASRGQQLESTLAVYAISMNVSSVFALFIGMFIIYNSFAIAVTQRRPEIGILRALGAPRRQIRNLFLIESAISGVLGSVAGIAVGMVMARAMVGSISSMLEGIYGVAERADEVLADPWLLTTAMAIGVTTSMIAAWLPARNASRVDPVQALQKGKYQVLTAGENRARRLGATVLMAVALIFLWIGRSIWFYAGYVSIVVAALLLVPTVSLWFARVLRPILKWLRPVEGALAADSLIQSPRRTSGAVAALMLSLGQVIGLGGVGRESYNSIVDWMNTTLNPDLFVAGSQNLSDRTFRFPKTLGPQISDVPGVAQVQTVRSLRVNVRGTPVMLVVIDTASFEERGRRQTVREAPGGMYTLTKAGRGVMVSDNFARLQKMDLGDTVDLATPAGMLSLPIVGILMDWSDQQGTVVLDRALYDRHWGDDTVNVFRVYVDHGSDPMDVRQRILERVGADQPRLLVLTNAEVRRWILQLTDQWLQLTYSQVFIAVLVAILGIVNTLTVSIIDRKRELGVLRAVGGFRRQIRQTVWMEAVAIGVVGLALGVLFGAANLYFLLEITGRDLSGMYLPYRFPAGIALALLPTILFAAFFSALWPAESAVRMSLVEALEYE
ncbi:MAG TPA: FtsX-like permease family protein [Vicinamibacterales bacterium]|nr:FtsX-like permease family protein [Vicinamibacterales bacterium]